MDYNAVVMEVLENIELARCERAKLVSQMEELQSAGMYYPLPRQDWQTNNGNEYLYLHFGSDGNGGYAGPGGKRKIYVGNKPEKVAEAEGMIERGAQWSDARTKALGLKYNISQLEQDLLELERALMRLLKKSKS